MRHNVTRREARLDTVIALQFGGVCATSVKNCTAGGDRSAVKCREIDRGVDAIFAKPHTLLIRHFIFT